MSTSINSNISGKFIVEDVHGNVLAEEHNAISDWGMKRLTNFDKQYSEKYIRTLSDNLKRIYPGTGATAVPGNYKLASKIDPKFYDHFNEASVTGTAYSRNTANNNLVITFTKGSRLEFKQPSTAGPLEIKELGIGFNYDTQDEHSYKNRRVAASTDILGHVPGAATSTVAVPPYIDHTDDVDFSLWSRTVFDGSTVPYIYVESGDILIVKYVLTIETDCDKTKTNWAFAADSTTGAVSMPNRKTGVRRKPFYSLLSGKSSQKAGSTILEYGDVPTEEGGRYGQYSGNISSNPNGFLGILPTLEQPYLGKNEVFLYKNVNTTFYAKFPDFNTQVETTFPSMTANAAPLSAVFVTSTIPYHPIKSQLRHSYRTLQNGNTYVCQHRFLFNPGEWPTINNSFNNDARSFALVRFNCDYQDTSNPTIAGAYTGSTAPVRLQPAQTDIQNCGIFTMLSAAYDPYINNAAMYVGLDYTFTFTRQ